MSKGGSGSPRLTHFASPGSDCSSRRSCGWQTTVTLRQSRSANGTYRTNCERVSEALLGVKKKGVVGESGAVPLGLHGATVRGKVVALPAPLILLPAFCQVSVEQQRQSEVFVPLGVAWLEDDRADRPRPPHPPGQAPSKERPDRRALGRSGIKRYGLSAGRDSAVSRPLSLKALARLAQAPAERGWRAMACPEAAMASSGRPMSISTAPRFWWASGKLGLRAMAWR